MKIKITLLFLSFFLIISFIFLTQNTVKADDLSNSISEQLENIDLTGLENYFNDFNINEGVNIIEKIKDMLKGDYSFDYKNIFSYIFSSVLTKSKELAPTFLCIIAIAIFMGITNSVKSSFLDNQVSEIVFIGCFCGIILLVLGQVFLVYSNVKITIENISKLSEIISPIIITLMVSSGGSASASIFKPMSTFLTGGIIELIVNILLPLVIIMFIFLIISNLSNTLKLKKSADFISCILKWIIGIIISIFSIFSIVQGIASSVYDGVSIKAAKYLLSNSIPLIGGFIKDGFDVIIAGSILIKNSIGIAGVFLLFYTILSPLITIASLSLLLKFTASIIEPISDSRISTFCTSTSKFITYLLVLLIMVGIMIFINILLMIFAANSVVT